MNYFELVNDTIAVERFWSKVDIPEDRKKCWLWIGSIYVNNKLGRFNINNKSYVAHKFSYLIHQKHLVSNIIHICNNKICVNPSHLISRKEHYKQLQKYSKDEFLIMLEKDLLSYENFKLENLPKIITHLRNEKGERYVDLIKLITINKSLDYSISERLYMILKDLDKRPSCQICSKEVKFQSIVKGYRRYCSSKCVSNDKNLKEKIKLTFIKRFGVDNPSKIESVKEKKRNKSIERFNTTCTLNSSEVKEKTRKTNQDRYNCDHATQSIIVKEKTKRTNQKRYNCDYATQVSDVKDKMKSTTLRKSFNRLLISDRLRNHYKPLFSIDDYKGVKSINDELIYYDFECLKCSTSFKDYLTNGHIPRCPTCYPSSYSSGEQELFEFCQQNLNITIFRNDRDIIKPSEIDIYIPDLKFGIEFNGIYWHSEISGRKSKNYHQKKLQLALQKNIRLVQIFEDEWIDKRSIVESILLNKFELSSNRIFARKCGLVSVSNNDANEFYFNNHIQGSLNGTHFGLVFEDNLVSLMTMGKPRFSKDYNLEMYRFCSILKTNVIGGLSKLLKAFIRCFNPKSIMTYCDARFGTGEGYLKSAFSYKKLTSPNYFYLKSQHRYSRNQFQKHLLESKLESFDSNLTEWENMQLSGYDRIWDAGNFVYEMIL